MSDKINKPATATTPVGAAVTADASVKTPPNANGDTAGQAAAPGGRRVTVANPEVAALADISKALAPLTLKQQARILSFLNQQVNEQLAEKSGTAQ